MLEQCPIVRMERGCWWFSSRPWIPSANPTADPSEPFLLVCYFSLFLKSLCCHSVNKGPGCTHLHGDLHWQLTDNPSQGCCLSSRNIQKKSRDFKCCIRGCVSQMRKKTICSQLLHCTSFKHRVINAVSGKFFSKSYLKAWWGVCPLPCSSGRMLTFYHKAIINNGF